MTHPKQGAKTANDAAMTRREALGVAAGLGAAAALGACGASSRRRGTDGAASCTVYPQQMEGPYYVDLDQLRSDIAEGREGMPLELTLQVLDADGCAPLPNAAVDIWHCDPAGDYSGYPGQPGGVDTTGQTFLRGTQVTDADGRVHFQTLYPGWYPGRTTHIHFKVHKTSTSQATSQMYFDDEVTAAVYATAPYDARGQKDTSNALDGVAGGNFPLVTLTPQGAGYAATLIITVA